ncbi:hypothetical protein Q7C18_07505 [Nesterenkonia sp. CL21]|uniref:hypothetical protein n=1 Tax=Nesterenkonia sp. CL21 TaxID=3064894 RepID=UPI00287AD270|nr:hypothetical protein [Nesterenkonia sp. CL21]MDS2172535.1 hypothetical protein [Nesterenkonia sp. CL21]
MPDKIMTVSRRVPVYWVVLVVAVVALVWIAVEAFIPGVTDQVTTAAETVAGSAATVVTAIGAIIAAVLALRNRLDDEPPGDDG